MGSVSKIDRRAAAVADDATGERKTVTILLADIVDSMKLTCDLDTEVAAGLLAPAIQCVEAAVRAHDGIVQREGDAILGVFGAPISQEQHARSALQAALQMLDACGSLPVSSRGRLRLRIGVHTGEVIVRMNDRGEPIVVDYAYAIGVAKRLQESADPDSVRTSRKTRDRTEGYFEFKRCRSLYVPDRNTPLGAYTVLRGGHARTRFEVAVKRKLSRFVGRQLEMQQLAAALAEAEAGRGQVIAVVGDAGVGKCRLIYEFKRKVQHRHLTLETFAIPHGESYSFSSLVALLHTYFGLSRDETAASRREAVSKKLHELNLESDLPLLLSLLDLSDPAIAGSKKSRERILDAVARLLLREATRRPLLLVFSDLHWHDEATLAFVELLATRIAAAPLLLVVTYRPGFAHRLATRSYYSLVRLGPLDNACAQLMLSDLLGNAPALDKLKEHIWDRTRGNPLFMEEIVRALRERGFLEPNAAGTLRITNADFARCERLPEAVAEVLAARIDRLDPRSKSLLQTLALLGNGATLGLVAKVLPWSPAELRRCVATLIQREFVDDTSSGSEPKLSFRHDLIRLVAYGSTLLPWRKRMHKRAGFALEEAYGPNVEDHCHQIAHHFARGDEPAKAIEYLRHAARQALRRSAQAEAVRQIDLALELLETIDDDPNRGLLEFELKIALGTGLIATRGHADDCIREVYLHLGKARAAESAGRGPFHATFGLWLFHLLRANLTDADLLSAQLSRDADRNDPGMAVEAEAALGVTLFSQGHFSLARPHLEAAIAQYDPDRDCWHDSQYGQDPGVASRAHLAWLLWYIGRPREALEELTRASALAVALKHWHTRAFLEFAAGSLHQRLGHVAQTLDHATVACEIASQRGYPLWNAMGMILRGWALARQGRGSAGAPLIAYGRGSLETMHAKLGQPYFLGLAADADVQLGRRKDALETVTTAIHLARKTGNRTHEAELHLLKGEILFDSDEAMPAWRALDEGLGISRRQGARLAELRILRSRVKVAGRVHDVEQAIGELRSTWETFDESVGTMAFPDIDAFLERSSG